MRRAAKLSLALVAAGVVAGAAGLALFVEHGISARDQPTALEALIARQVRHLAIPRAARGMPNPEPASREGLTRARAHFADHCAACHGNDGRGKTAMGQNLYPRAPDMTLPDTQNLSDGELFAIIENGIRLTGMPAWGRPGPSDDAQTWELVHFIRRLPALTPEDLAEMKALNPRGRDEWEQEEAERKFLEGGDVPDHGGHQSE
jgi:mono/diheme cytochrome c family protein